MRGIISLSGTHCRLHGIKVGLLLELADVFLVSNSLVAEPVGDLAREKNTRQKLLFSEGELENVGKCSRCVMNSCF